MVPPQHQGSADGGEKRPCVRGSTNVICRGLPSAASDIPRVNYLTLTAESVARGLGEVEIRRGCDCLGRLTGRDVWEKISFPLEESAIV